MRSFGLPVRVMSISLLGHIEVFVRQLIQLCGVATYHYLINFGQCVELD